MKKVLLLVCLMFFALFVNNAVAQMPLTANDELWQLLDGKVQKKLTKADKLMQKALDYNAKIEFYEKQIEATRNQSKGVKFRKIEKLERQRNETVVKSGPYFEDAYTYSYKALTKQIALMQRQGGNADIASLTTKARERYREAKKYYHKAEQTAKAKRQTEMVVLGGQRMRESLKLQVDAVALLFKQVYAQTVQSNADEPVSVVEPVLEVPVVENSILADSSVVAPDTVAIIQPPVVADSAKLETPVESAANLPTETLLGDVFLTIQIMSSTTKASSQQIKAVYSGSLTVNEIVSGEYFRYVIGKFSSVEAAKATIASEGIKGFVVAFKGNERIPVNEAVQQLSGTK